MPGAVADKVVLLPRYSTFAGSGTFTTLPINVTAYDSISVAAWRGKMEPDGTFSFKIEASVDRENWVVLAGSDPGADTELLFGANLTKPWLRGRTEVNDTGSGFPVVSAWAVGELYRRRK